MTTMICFLVLILTLVSSFLAQNTYFHNPSWGFANRHNFMAPIHIYAGVNKPKNNHPTAPPIDTVRPIDYNRKNPRNYVPTTRTTYFFYPISTTTVQTKSYYYYRRRNRTRLTTSPIESDSNLQNFGVIVNILDRTDAPITTSSSSSMQRPWWTLASSTTTSTTTTTATTKATITTQSFYERFPTLPPQIKKLPPPTVPRSFTSSTTFTYSSTRKTTIDMTSTMKNSSYIYSQSSKASKLTYSSTRGLLIILKMFLLNLAFSSSHQAHRPTLSWIFNVSSFSQIIDQYPQYSTILRWFDELSNHPNISRFFAYETVGHTHENRSLVIAKIGLMPFGKNRRSVWLDGGIHAREWISTATVLHIIACIINGTLARDSNVRRLIDKYDFYFMPVVNPDGYVYTHDDVKTDLNSHEQDRQRMWRKNRRPHSECPGVDLNRNFPFAWDNRGTSKFPCEETYRGPYPESEPEVRAITSFILKRRRYFHTFVTLHAFGNLWMLPFSFSTRIRPYDYYRTERLLSQMNSLSMNTFRIGQSSTVLYAATGTSEDWAKAIAQIPHTFSIELPPSTDAFDMRQDDLNGFQFYSDKDISIVAESTYRLLQLYLRNLAKIRHPSQIAI